VLEAITSSSIAPMPDATVVVVTGLSDGAVVAGLSDGAVVAEVVAAVVPAVVSSAASSLLHAVAANKMTVRTRMVDR
jgi:hypothetical protein